MENACRMGAIARKDTMATSARLTPSVKECWGNQEHVARAGSWTMEVTAALHMRFWISAVDVVTAGMLMHVGYATGKRQ